MTDQHITMAQCYTPSQYIFLKFFSVCKTSRN